MRGAFRVTTRGRRERGRKARIEKSMRLLRKSIGYATVGAGVAGVTIYLTYGPDELKRRITSNGLVRVARAARAVSR